MSVDNALAYIRRMRSDADFRKVLNDNSEDETANWAYVKAAGYEFTMPEFREAQDVIYREFGVDPHWGR